MAKHSTRPPAKVRMIPARERATDLGDARFTIKAVIGIVALTATLIGSQWAFSSSLQSSISKLDARMDAKDKIDERDDEASKREVAADKRIMDEWKSTIEKQIAQIERDYKLADYDIKALLVERLKP